MSFGAGPEYRSRQGNAAVEIPHEGAEPHGKAVTKRAAGRWERELSSGREIGRWHMNGLRRPQRHFSEQRGPPPGRTCRPSGSDVAVC